MPKKKKKEDEEVSKLDFDNLDYIHIGTAIGVIGAIIWGMKEGFTFKKTALYSLLLGATGAYVGVNLKRVLKSQDEE